MAKNKDAKPYQIFVSHATTDKWLAVTLCEKQCLKESLHLTFFFRIVTQTQRSQQTSLEFYVRMT